MGRRKKRRVPLPKLMVKGVPPDVIHRAWETFRVLLKRMDEVQRPSDVPLRHADNKSFEQLKGFLLELIHIQNELENREEDTNPFA